MGNTLQYKEDSTDRVLADCQKREKLFDDRLGTVTVYNLSHSPTEMVILKERWLNSQIDSNELNAFVGSRSLNNHKGLALLLAHGMDTKSQGCSDFYRHYMVFEYFPNNLELEIFARQQAGNFQAYTEPEIWYLIELLNSILNSFVQRGYHHGDIQPKTLMIDQHGFVKLLDSSIINYGETAYSKCIVNPKYKASLSPKLMSSLKFKEVIPMHDSSKSDIYSIAITCLCASLNTTLDNYYDFDRLILHGEQVRKSLLDMLQLGFSRQIVQVLESMLHENEASRVSCVQLNEFLESNNAHMNAGIIKRVHLPYKF